MRIFWVCLLFLYCSSLEATPRNPLTSERKAGFNGGVFSKVLEQKFQRLPGNLGTWRGVVQGHGRIKLWLQILEDGKVVSSRTMGETTLKNGKSTFFVYKTSLPRLRNWSWKVVSHAMERRL